MTVDELKKLEDTAFAKMRERYRNLTSGDLQTIVIAFEFLNIEFEEKKRRDDEQARSY